MHCHYIPHLKQKRCTELFYKWKCDSSSNYRLYSGPASDLCQTCDNEDRESLWAFLTSLGVQRDLADTLKLLYTNTSSWVRVKGQPSTTFEIRSRVWQGWVLVPTIFNTATDSVVMNHTAAHRLFGAILSEVCMTGLDYADDVALLLRFWGSTVWPSL